MLPQLVTLLITVPLWSLVHPVQNPRCAAPNFSRPDFDRCGWSACVVGKIGALDVLGAADGGHRTAVAVHGQPSADLSHRAAATLVARMRPGDTVFTGDTNAPTMLAVLQPKDQVPIDASALVTSKLDVTLARWKRGSRVWAVNVRSTMGPGETLDTFKGRVAALGASALEISKGREIAILMFDAPGAAASISAHDDTSWPLTPPITTAIESSPVSRRRIAP